MKPFLALTIVTIVLVCHINSSLCQVDGLMGACPPEVCKLDQNYFESKEFKLKLYKLFSAGIPQILWDHFRDEKVSGTHLNVSQACQIGFQSVWQGIEKGDEWAFKYLDTSGKLPASFIEATHTAIGDFNECLQPTSVVPIVPTQYCMFEVFPDLPRVEMPGKFYIGHKKTCYNCPFFQGLCLPASCSDNDLRNILNESLRPFALSVNGYMYCDNVKSISYETKFSNFSGHQWISLMFLIVLFTTISACTAVHVVRKFKSQNVEDDLATRFSLARNGWSLFHVRESHLTDPRRNIMDAFKLISVFCISISHGLNCADVPLAYFIIDRLQYFQAFLRAPQTQGLYNDAGLSGICAFGGFAAFAVMYPMAKKKQLPYIFAFLDRYLKFVPSMIGITALEFIWPILGSGPFHSHLSRFIIDRCHRGWWANLFLINNLIDPLNTCAGHTFFASMTLQIVIFALITTKIFSQNDARGVKFCCLLIFYSWAKMYYNVVTNDMTPTLMTPIPDIPRNKNYFEYIHEPWSTYLSPFFMGFLASYWVTKGNKLKIFSLFDWLKWLTIASTPFAISHLVCMTSNSYNAMPDSLIPLSIVVNRNMMGLGSVLMILILYSENQFSHYLDAKAIEGEVNGNNNEMEKNSSGAKEKIVFSLFTGLLRISFSIFFINLYVARFEFFARKSLIANEALTNVQRGVSTTALIVTSAIVFHLFCVAPFDQLLKYATKGAREKHAKSQ